MGRILIVAEKPAQAREYARTLGVNGKAEGALANEKYVITWCYGHLLELERPEHYMDLEKVGKRWSLNRLPVLPDLNSFRRVIKPGASNQYKVIQQWLKSPEIDQVICGTDADREGQLLFQEVWDAVKCRKTLSRLWISSLTAEAVREGMANLRPAQSVEGLAAAGYGRSYSDWDFGMNLTEGFTALFGSFDTVRKRPNVISIGRVQTPTLALIVERETEIERFVPESYFELRAYFRAKQGEYSGRWFDPRETSKRVIDRRNAEEIAAKTKNKRGDIIKVERKNTQELPPLLFDLTSLTVAASKRFGYSADYVLKLAQSLYEKKAITYPRTDCAYLPVDLIPKLNDHLQAIRQEPYIDMADEAKSFGIPKGKRVINKITAHHAIIPTTEKITMKKLYDGEQKVYDLVVRRFLAVWFPPACYQQTEVITVVEEEHFRTKGKVMQSPGWKKVFTDGDDDSEKEQKKKKKDEDEEEFSILPPLTVGENVHVEKVNIEEKSTKPPRRYTQGDLLKAMESAGKQIDDEVLRQQLKGKGLGTVATRPAILEGLIERGYVIQEKKVLKPTEKGTELIRLIKEKLPRAQLLISAEMTGQMEFDLSKVEQGELSLASYMADAEEAVRQIIEELRSYESIHGKTPLGFVSSRKEKDYKTEKSSKRKEGHTENNLESNKNINKSKHKGEGSKKDKHANVNVSLGSCPSCGGLVIEGQKGYGCSNWRKGCSFVVWKNPICGKVLTPNQIKSLLKKGKTPLIKGFKSKAGKSFSAYLAWEDQVNGKLRFEFEKHGLRAK